MREINGSAGHSQYAVELLQLDTTLYPFLETSPLVISEISQQTKGHEKSDHMKKLPPRGFSGTMNPQEKKT